MPALTLIPSPREAFNRLPHGFTPEHPRADEFHRLCESEVFAAVWRQLTPARRPWLIVALYGWWCDAQQETGPTARTRKTVTRTLSALRELNTPALPEQIRAAITGAEKVCRWWLEGDDFWAAQRRAHVGQPGRPSGVSNASLYARVLAECKLSVGAMATLAPIFAPRHFDPALSASTLRKRLASRIADTRDEQEVRAYLRNLRRALRST